MDDKTDNTAYTGLSRDRVCVCALCNTASQITRPISSPIVRCEVTIPSGLAIVSKNIDTDVRMDLFRQQVEVDIATFLVGNTNFTPCSCTSTLACTRVWYLKRDKSFEKRQWYLNLIQQDSSSKVCCKQQIAFDHHSKLEFDKLDK